LWALIQLVLLDEQVEDMIETIQQRYPVVKIASGEWPVNGKSSEELRQTMKRDSESFLDEIRYEG